MSIRRLTYALVLAIVCSVAPAGANENSTSKLKELYLAAVDSTAACFINADYATARRWADIALRAMCDSDTYYIHQFVEVDFRMLNGHTHGAIETIDSALDYFAGRKDSTAIRGKALALCSKGYHELITGSDSAAKYFGEAQALLDSAGNHQFAAYCTQLQAESMIEKSQYVQAAKLSRKLLDTGRKLKNRQIEFYALLQLYKIYTKLHANAYVESYGAEIENNGYLKSINNEVKYLHYKTIYKMHCNDFVEAERVANKLIQSIELVATGNSTWRSYLLYARLMTTLGKLDIAEEYLDRCKNRAQRLNDLSFDSYHARFHIPITEAWISLGRHQYQRAKNIFDSVNIPKKMLQRSDFSNTYFTGYEMALAGVNEYKKATELLYQHSLMLDSVRIGYARQRALDMEEIFRNDTTILKQRALIYETDKSLSTARTQTVLWLMLAILLLMLLIMVHFLSKRNERRKRERMEIKLKERLEHEVERHTKLLRRQNAVLSERNADIIRGKTYAKRIQDGILPSIDILNEQPETQNSFVFIRTLDHISSCFYWFNVQGNRTIVICADCPERGVSGSLLSIACITLMYDGTRNNNLQTAGELLTDIDHKFISIMHNVSETNGIRMTVAIIDTAKNEINIAAARQNVIFMQGNRPRLIRGTRRRIGDSLEPFISRPFADKTINYSTGDSLYLYTKGLSTLFGGNDADTLKTARLVKILTSASHLDPEEREGAIREDILEWHGSTPENDDMLLIGISLQCTNDGGKEN